MIKKLPVLTSYFPCAYVGMEAVVVVCVCVCVCVRVLMSYALCVFVCFLLFVGCLKNLIQIKLDLNHLVNLPDSIGE